jgi:hypothetical protein
MRRCRYWPGTLQYAGKFRNDFIWIGANQNIRAILKRNRPFRVLSQGDAWNAQDRGFLLNTAGIGQDDLRARGELEKI